MELMLYGNSPHEPASEALVLNDLDWLPQSGDITGTPAGYKRAPREDVIV